MVIVLIIGVLVLLGWIEKKVEQAHEDREEIKAELRALSGRSSLDDDLDDIDDI